MKPNYSTIRKEKLKLETIPRLSAYKSGCNRMQHFIACLPVHRCSNNAVVSFSRSMCMWKKSESNSRKAVRFLTTKMQINCAADRNKASKWMDVEYTILVEDYCGVWRSLCL